MLLRILLLSASSVLLAGCGSAGDTRAPRPAAPVVSPAELVAQVRAVGETGHELEVQPLRDPQVEDLRAKARALEQAGDAAGASGVLDQALSITPDDPDLLQWQAELALLQRQWMRAERLAARSFELGPKLGGLCRRNWATIGHARAMRGAAQAADVAHQQAGSCIVAPPARM